MVRVSQTAAFDIFLDRLNSIEPSGEPTATGLREALSRAITFPTWRTGFPVQLLVAITDQPPLNDLTFVPSQLLGQGIIASTIQTLKNGVGSFDADTQSVLEGLTERTNGVIVRSNNTDTNVSNAIDAAISRLCDPLDLPASLSSFAAAEPIEPISVGIDPLLNVGSVQSSVKVELPSGYYSATIESTDTRIGDMHGGVIRIQHIEDGSRKVVQFLDKGGFDSLVDSQSAYEGLSLGFNHDGGLIHIYYPMIPTMNASGQTVIRIEPSKMKRKFAPQVKPEVVKSKKPLKTEPVKHSDIGNINCQMSLSHLSWYQKGWDTNNCCGLVVNVAGQDWIIFKRSMGNDTACGGGESESTSCISTTKDKLGQYPAFAWPTFDGKTFAPLPKSELVTFQFDSALNELVSQQIIKSEYDNPKGSPSGYRHLVYQLSAVLFPVA